MSAKSLNFFGPPTTKWRPCNIFAKFNWNQFLMTNIFKLHEYQTFGLMKMHSMSKIWFNSLRWNKIYFSWFFKGFQLPEIVSWKEDSCVISHKRAAVSWDIVTQAWNFQLLLNSKSSKLSLRYLLKNYLFSS